MKLRMKIFLIFLSLFVTLSVFVGFLSFLTANRIIIDNYTTKVEENLDYMYNNTSAKLYNFNSAINYLISSEALHRRMALDIDTYTQLELINADTELNNVISNFVNFDFFQSLNNIYIFNTNGFDFYGSVGFISEYHKELYKEMAFATAYDTDNKLQYVEDKKEFSFIISDSANLRFFKPVYDYGEAFAYLFIDVDSSYFFDLASMNKLEASTVTYMIDAGGMILQSSNPEQIGEYFEYPTENSIVEERQLSSFGWKLVSVTPSNLITEDSYNIINQTLLLIVFFILVAGVFLFIFTDKMTMPIKKLMSGLEKVRKGNLDVHIEKTTTDEIGDMTDAFNTMVSDLNMLVDQRIEYIKEVNNAQYKVLQAQINPHFIYNTLNTVKFMAQVQNAVNISNMVDLISDLLRLSSHTTGQFVPLEQEMLIVETYVKIQQIRYNYKFKYTINMGEDCKNVIVPKFIVQPIAENAIFHGIEPKRGLGVLNINCFIQNNVLHISVSDNGIGMTDDKIHEILSNKTTDTNGLNGIGLPNVNNRLILLFGEEYSLKIKSKQGEGTEMSINLPTNHEYKQRGTSNV